MEATFDSFAERVAHDRGESFDEQLDPAECMSEWMNTRALRNRGLYVPCFDYYVFRAASVGYGV